MATFEESSHAELSVALAEPEDAALRRAVAGVMDAPYALSNLEPAERRETFFLTVHIAAYILSTGM